MNDKQEIMVTIRCITYNHESYIRQCLEGFVMQKTNFRFEAIVHDDASTDGTANIIREFAEKYPDIIKPIYETENQYSKRDGSLSRIMDAHTHGRYVAMCEGDDYWTDPYKLQKQVDFLEANPEYGLVYGKARVYDQEKKCFEKKTTGHCCCKVEDLMVASGIPTLTVLFRRELRMMYIEEIGFHKEWKMGDYPMWLFFAIKTKIYFLDEVVAVYRKLLDSATMRNNFDKRQIFSKSVYDIKKFFNDKYQLGFCNLNSDCYRQLFLNSILFCKREEALSYFCKIENKKIRDKILGVICENYFLFSLFCRFILNK